MQKTLHYKGQQTTPRPLLFLKDNIIIKDMQNIQPFESQRETESVTIHWKAVEQYFTVVLFVFQFLTGL